MKNNSKLISADHQPPTQNPSRPGSGASRPCRGLKVSRDVGICSSNPGAGLPTIKKARNTGKSGQIHAPKNLRVSVPLSRDCGIRLSNPGTGHQPKIDEKSPESKQVQPSLCTQYFPRPNPWRPLSIPLQTKSQSKMPIFQVERARTRQNYFLRGRGYYCQSSMVRRPPLPIPVHLENPTKSHPACGTSRSDRIPDRKANLWLRTARKRFGVRQRPSAKSLRRFVRYQHYHVFLRIGHLSKRVKNKMCGRPNFQK